jgi:hypothetical protein
MSEKEDKEKVIIPTNPTPNNPRPEDPMLNLPTV